MRQDSGHLSIVIGVGILACVTLSIGGMAFSFYRSEAKEAKEEAAEMVKESIPLSPIETKTETKIVPVEEPEGGSRGIDSFAEGIPTGTYSNPPTTIPSGNSSYYSTGSSSSLSAIPYGSSVENNRESQRSLTNSLPDYSSPSSSNNFHNTEDNSLIQPLDNSDFLESPTDGNNSSESSYFNDSQF